MGNVASELANSSSSKSRVAAEILSKAKADARHFLPVVDLNEKKRSDKVQRCVCICAGILKKIDVLKDRIMCDDGRLCTVTQRNLMPLTN